MPRRVIIPKGVVDPTRTAVVEIPSELLDEKEVVAVLPTPGQSRVVVSKRVAGGADCPPCDEADDEEDDDDSSDMDDDDAVELYRNLADYFKNMMNKKSKPRQFKPKVYSTPVSGDAPQWKHFGDDSRTHPLPTEYTMRRAYIEKHEKSPKPYEVQYTSADYPLEGSFHPGPCVQDVTPVGDNTRAMWKNAFGQSYDSYPTDIMDQSNYPFSSSGSGSLQYPSGGSPAEQLEAALDSMEDQEGQELDNAMGHLEQMQSCRRQLFADISELESGSSGMS